MCVGSARVCLPAHYQPTDGETGRKNMRLAGCAECALGEVAKRALGEAECALVVRWYAYQRSTRALTLQFLAFGLFCT